MSTLSRFSTALGAALMATAIAAAPAKADCSFTMVNVGGGRTLFFGRDDYQSKFLNKDFSGTNALCAKNAFVNAVANAGMTTGLEDFESKSFNLTFDGTTVEGDLTKDGDGQFSKRSDSGEAQNDRYPVSGTWYYADNDDWQIDFSEGVHGFGFWGVDIAEEGLNDKLKIQFGYEGTAQEKGSCKVWFFVCLEWNYVQVPADVAIDDFTVGRATTGFEADGDGIDRKVCNKYYQNGTCKEWKTDQYESGDLFFFAILDDQASIDWVKFFEDNTHNTDKFAIDDFYVVTPGDDPPGGGQEVVPEPATMTLLASGLVGMAAARRRRKQQQN